MRAVIILIVMSISLASSLSSSYQVKAKDTNQCLFYDIDIEGEVTMEESSIPFTKNGTLALWTSGIEYGENEKEIWLQVGKPVTKASTGSIFIASNAFFLKSLDKSLRSGVVTLADVEEKKNKNGTTTFTLTMREDFAFGQSMINVFSLGKGITASMELIQSGKVVIVVSKDMSEIKGQVEVLGRYWMMKESEAYIWYKANITGILDEESITDDVSFCVSLGQ